MNNISTLIKKRQINYLSKNEEDFFVYNIITKKDKANTTPSQEINNKKSTTNHITSNLDNGFIMETSQSNKSKNSNKDGDVQRINSLNSVPGIGSKIEKMIKMNKEINNGNTECSRAKPSETKFSCCGIKS